MAVFIHSPIKTVAAAFIFCLMSSGVLSNDLKVIVHSTSGGHMIHAKIWAKNAKKYHDGNIIVHAIPGGIGIAAANYLYNVAARDGSEIGSLHSTVTAFSMLGESTVKYDLAGFNWLGSVLDGRKDPFLILAKAGPEPLVAGVEGGLSINHIKFANKFLGLRIKEVSGYQDVGQLKLAFEKNEVNLIYRNLVGIKTIAPEWLLDTRVMPLIQYGNGNNRHALYPNSPTLMDFAKSDEDRQAIDAFEKTLIITRGFVAPPNVPMDKVNHLRVLFASVLSDKEYLAETEKVGISVTPIYWSEIEKIVKEIKLLSPEISGKLRQF